jgi:hypothetical protein
MMRPLTCCDSGPAKSPQTYEEKSRISLNDCVPTQRELNETLMQTIMDAYIRHRPFAPPPLLTPHEKTPVPAEYTRKQE